MAEIMISPRKIGMIKPIKRRIINFSRIELKDLVKAWIAISIAFGILFSRFSSLTNFVVMFVISLFTVGIGFLFHEMAHKLVAQHYGCWAEFRANNQMLLFAIFMSFFGFVFAAPGAVMIQGAINKEQNGKISIAGPLTNIILALIFLLLSGVISLSVAGINVMAMGFRINSLLALFNMIPFGMFDGAKVFNWNKTVYGITVGVALILFFII